MEKDLLPLFARFRVRTFSPFKGPNCFHSALGFQLRGLNVAEDLNVKREKGYHSEMLNHDELFRSLKIGFSPVNFMVSKPRYGDLLVFIDPPQGARLDMETFDFRWIKHAAVFLFSGYVFSKGSKYPNSPYIIKPLPREWDAWDGRLANMVVIGFRRKLKSGRISRSKVLPTWLY